VRRPAHAPPSPRPAPLTVAPPQQVIIIQNGQAPREQWHSSECDMCAEPGGPGLACYVICCQPCAAGDVAVAAGRDYFCACCVAPVLGHLAHNDTLRDIIEGCFWMADRRALVQRYGVHDTLDDGSACSQAFCMMTCCPQCLLFQELNHIKHKALQQQGAVGAPVQKAMVM
jgi:hypothetical protein